MTEYVKDFDRRLNEKYDELVTRCLFQVWLAERRKQPEKAEVYRSRLEIMRKRKEALHAFNHAC